VTILRGENSKLKSRLLHDEKELVQKNKEIRKLLTQLSGPLHGSKEVKKGTGLVQGMKKRIAAAQKENKALKEAFDDLKKSLKMTNAQELSAEVKVYSDECVRLRNMMEKTGTTKLSSDVSEVDKKVVEKLKTENEDLNKELKKKTEEFERWKAKAEEKREALENSNKDLTKKVKILKDEIESLKTSDRSKEQAEELERIKAQLAIQKKEYEQRIKELEQRQTKPEKKTKAIIDKESIKDIVIELRFNFILSDVEDIKKVMLDKSNEVSIKELTEILKSNPAALSSDKAHTLARYLIEPRTSNEVVYDEMLTKSTTNIAETLNSLIGKYTVDFNKNPEVLQESLLEKVNEKLQTFAETLQDSANDEGYITYGTLQSICGNMELSQDELDYIALTMYKESKDLNKLQYEIFVEHLNDLLNKLLEHEQSNQEESEHEIQKESSRKSKEKDEELNEEQVLALVQTCFTEIAEKIAGKGIAVEEVFGENVYTKVIDGEEVKLISPQNFTKALKKLGVRKFEAAEEAYLNKMLMASETEAGYKVKDIIQILNDYGIAGDNEENGNNIENHAEKNEEEVNIEDLDKVSMVLLLALTEYLSNTNSSLEKVFESVAYKQPVQIDDEELEIDIVNSKDFFETINGIGIETEEDQHDNLKAFLCLDPSYSDKFSLDKLRMAVEEFKNNEEVRECAKQYYQELVDADQVQEDNDE
jgi:hypothetical protein